MTKVHPRNAVAVEIVQFVPKCSIGLTRPLSFYSSNTKVEQVRKVLKGCAEAGMGGFVRLLGFTTLGCGCIVGRYRELATNRDVNYVEEKGEACKTHGHRRNHTISDRIAGASMLTAVRTAS